jgi:hypothetical protein
VPLYVYPDATWDLLVQARRDHPRITIVAIVNPASGPGRDRDPNYVSGIAKLRKAGVVLLGYVTTSYAKRTIPEVTHEVEQWRDLYHPDGIFYDEMAYEPGNERYYRELDRHAKATGFGLTIGNPGTEVAPGYAGSLDAILLYENSGVPPLDSLGGWHAQHPRTRWGVIPYGVPELDRAFLREASGRVGFLFMTDQKMPDPWDHLPVYFLDLVAALDSPV